MAHRDRPFGYRQALMIMANVNVNFKRHQLREPRYASETAVSGLQPCIESSAPARCEREDQPYKTSAVVLCQARPTTSSPASLASPGRPVPPSIMPSRTKNKPARSGIGMTAHSTRRRHTTVVPCGSQSGDMGRARTLHSSRDVLFGPSLLTGEVGWFVKAFLGLGRPGDWTSSMPAYLTGGCCLTAAHCCLFLLLLTFFLVRYGTQNQRTCRL